MPRYRIQMGQQEEREVISALCLSQDRHCRHIPALRTCRCCIYRRHILV